MKNDWGMLINLVGVLFRYVNKVIVVWLKEISKVFSSFACYKWIF